MNDLKPILCLFLLSSPLVAEQVVEPAPFEVEIPFSAKFLPENATVYELQPEAWSDFQIKSLAAQGSQVKKDDVLIEFESEKFQKHFESVQSQAVQKKLTLEQAREDLADLEVETPRLLARAKLSAERETENRLYFENTERALSEAAAKQSLARAERALGSAEEELKQLLKMYEEDNLVEETEEIILKNQRASVENARVNLTATQEKTARTLEVHLPRKQEDWERSQESLVLAYQSAQSTLPRKLALKKIEVADLEREVAALEKSVEDLSKDKALLILKAPSDGVVYYGAMADGKWLTDSAVKFMKIGGKVPAYEPFLSLVPKDAPLVLEAFVAQKTRLALAPGLKGTLTVSGLDEKVFPVTLKNFAQFSGVDGKYRVSLDSEVPNSIVPGMIAKVVLIAHQKGAALSIPRSFVKKQADGTHSVRVKLADGKDEWRPVELGAVSGDQVEITKGLEADQVVLPLEDAKSAEKIDEKPEKKADEKSAE